MTRTCMWCPPVQQESLEYGKAYIQQIEILHYIDNVKKKKMIWTLLCKLWLYFTLALHPTHITHVHYITIIKNIFGKLNSFLQTYVIS